MSNKWASKKSAKKSSSSFSFGFAKALLAWYDQQAVDLPWRNRSAPYRADTYRADTYRADAYRVWLSEIMLQQTRVSTVIGYYTRFLKTFPTVKSLAAASLDAVLKQWEGLGYYSRARNLHRAAQTVVNDYGGQFPATANTLQTLPGVGSYTAAAIASIAFNEPIAALDGNVMRILTRIYDYAEALGSPGVTQQLHMWAQGLLDATRPGDFNQAMMDLGRTICLPRNPLCPQCPVSAYCLAFKNQTQNLRPVKKKKAPLPTVRAAAAILRDQQERLLLVQRPPSGLLGGLWTLPGGTCEPEESFTACLHRVIPNEFGLAIKVNHEISTAQQTFTHFHLRLRAYACEIEKGRLKLKNQVPFAWVKPDELSHYSFGKADRAILDALTNEQPRLFEE